MEALSQAQLRDVEDRLGRIEADLSARLKGLNDDQPAPGDMQERDVGDQADMAERNTERADDSALLDHYRSQLADIDAARDRIRDGTFGVCEDCGQAIPFERLQVYPTARRCAPCQERHERLYAGRGAG